MSSQFSRKKIVIYRENIDTFNLEIENRKRTLFYFLKIYK